MEAQQGLAPLAPPGVEFLHQGPPGAVAALGGPEQVLEGVDRLLGQVRALLPDAHDQALAQDLPALLPDPAHVAGGLDQAVPGPQALLVAEMVLPGPARLLQLGAQILGLGHEEDGALGQPGLQAHGVGVVHARRQVGVGLQQLLLQIRPRALGNLAQAHPAVEHATGGLAVGFGPDAPGHGQDDGGLELGP